MRADPSLASPSSLPCPGCAAELKAAALAEFLWVCPVCGYHFPLAAHQRLEQIADRGSFVEWDAGVGSRDLLEFVDRIPYHERLRLARERTGLKEAVLTGVAKIGGHGVALGVFDFRFMGGSMGCAVGEKLARLFGRAATRGLPVLLVIASGGARMQEGCYALMQMGKVTAAAVCFKRGNLPYVALLANPTTGGVAASIAYQADLVLAEPGAVIGFAGRRVIEDTIKMRLPAGAQRAEALQERGFVDIVVPRPQLAPMLARLFGLLGAGEKGGPATGGAQGKDDGSGAAEDVERL